MTQREGHASGAVAKIGTRPAVHPAPASSAGARAGTEPSPSWEDLFRTLVPEKQLHLLELARAQGLLYGHQIPAPPNGAARDPAQCLIGKVLAGDTRELQPLHVEPLELIDTALDAAQREAVVRAVQGNDLLLIEGAPGSGKSRVVAEILAQAAGRGERVLLVAPTAPPLDRALELAGDREPVCAVRCLEKGENPESLRPTVRRFTADEQVRALTEQTARSAREMAQACARDCERLRADETAWDRFAELADRQQELEEQARALARLREQVPAAVEREAGTLTEELPAGRFGEELRGWDRQRRKARSRLEAEATELERARAEKSQEVQALTLEREQLQPMVEAYRLGRWWTPRYWHARSHGATPDQYETCESRLREAMETLERLEREAGDLAHRRAQADRDDEAKRSALLAAEAARRCDELADRETALRQERSQLESKWQALAHGLAPGAVPPAQATRAAVEAARSDWRTALERASERETFARRWAEHLAEHPRSLADRLPELINVVAATTGTLAREPLFGQGPPGSKFDLLIVEGAEQVTESEFLAVARRARRWVLVGTQAVESGVPKQEEPRQPASARRGTHQSEPRAPGRPSFFQRLWRRLHFDSAALPYSWEQDPERLRCRLRPLSAEQRRRLEVERVADSAEIELGILTESGKPSLVEVSFPAATPIGEAKRYIYHELQELPLYPAGDRLAWVEEPQRLVLRLGEASDPGGTPVLIDEGVRVVVGPAMGLNGSAGPRKWHTRSVEFDRGAGWHRRRAEEWLARHAGIRDLGRTVALATQYRMHPDLARFAASLELPVGAPPAEGGENPLLAASLDGRAARVEFVPVPALSRDRGPRPRDRGRPHDIAASLAQMKGGGGLEVSLDDLKHRDRIPTEVRAKLPAQGLVNYLEAEAVVRTLAHMAGDHAFGDALARTAAAAGASPTVAVLTLYPAQAALIRQMVCETPELAGTRFHLDVDVCAAYSQREALVVLLSLTRSHTHRAVAFGDDPDALALALTRARGKLLLFGDPGTLVRRTQWEGPVDHLDSTAANRERTWLCALVRYLQGRGPHPRVFYLREGNSA